MHPDPAELPCQAVVCSQEKGGHRRFSSFNSSSLWDILKVPGRATPMFWSYCSWPKDKLLIESGPDITQQHISRSWHAVQHTSEEIAVLNVKLHNSNRPNSTQHLLQLLSLLIGLSVALFQNYFSSWSQKTMLLFLYLLSIAFWNNIWRFIFFLVCRIHYQSTSVLFIMDLRILLSRSKLCCLNS